MEFSCTSIQTCSGRVEVKSARMQSVGNVEDPTLALDDSEVFPVLIEQSAATGYSPQAKRPPRELPCLPKSAADLRRVRLKVLAVLPEWTRRKRTLTANWF